MATKHLPFLRIKSADFRNPKGFENFLKGILSRRDSSTALNALNLELGALIFLDRKRQVRKNVRRVMRYAAKQNVNHLGLCFRMFGSYHQIPYSSLSGSSLTSLDMEFGIYPQVFPNSLNLPSLTYLKLNYLFFNPVNRGVDPFSTYNKLNTLILYKCYADITLYSKIELFAPSLCSFDITCNSIQKLSGSHLSSIKHLRIGMFEDIYSLETPLNLDILNWFAEMTHVESLMADSTTLRVLSIIPDLLKVKPPYWYNLKSLEVVKLNLKYVSYVLADGKSWKENTKLQEAIKAGSEPYSFIPHGVIDFLLQNSPSATFDITSVN